jgi:SAM-dependent methyltransferase
MNEEPHVWHYGLIAQIWAEFSRDTPELSYYLKKIERFGEPVLDLACGTGRLLLPLRRQGIDIDGCDISGDMLAHCQHQAEEERLRVTLFEQPMHAFNVNRRYGTIYICGSFGLAGSRDNDQETLKRCYEHLLPGGALLFNVDVEYAYPQAWLLWLKNKRETLPQSWPEEGKRYRADAGYDLVSRSRLLDVNPVEQSYTREMRVEKWQEGQLVAQEERTLRGNMYFKNEVVTMLHYAGFAEIEVGGDYSDEPATADCVELNLVAQR